MVPQKPYQIVRQLDNAGDTGTYYVQAVVRLTATDAVLATVNLAPKGKQRFSAPYQVPADTSGLGTYISITTSVYADSGYSQLSLNYDTEDAEYLVIQPPLSTYGNGGTTIVDYDRIRKLVGDVKFPGVPAYDKEFRGIREYSDSRFAEMKGHFDRTVGGMAFPKYDDSEVRQSVASLSEELRSARASHERQMGEMSRAHEKSMSDMARHFEDMRTAMRDHLGKLSEIAGRPYDSLEEHANLKKEYSSLLKVIGSVQTTGKYDESEAAKARIKERVDRLMRP